VAGFLSSEITAVKNQKIIIMGFSSHHFLTHQHPLRIISADAWFPKG
jgi:hypothetical protein